MAVYLFRNLIAGTVVGALGGWYLGSVASDSFPFSAANLYLLFAAAASSFAVGCFLGGFDTGRVAVGFAAGTALMISLTLALQCGLIVARSR